MELRALSRADLNGKRGVCCAFDDDAGRWEVELSTPDGKSKSVKVRAANLKAIISERCEALYTLCARLNVRYRERGFKVHPAVCFQADEHGGVCMRATANLNAGDILLVVPGEIGVTTRAAAYSADLKLPNGTAMKSVLDHVATVWKKRVGDNALGIIALEDVQLAVLLMHLACAPVDDLHKQMAAAWPSLDDARKNLPLFWSEHRLEDMRGTHAARNVELLKNEAERIFNRVVSFALTDPKFDAKGADDAGTPFVNNFRKGDAPLQDCFLFAFSLAYSRAHNSDTSDSSVGVVLPLIDAINGLPGPHEDINVEVNRGKWPFLRGSIFRDDINVECWAVAAKRDLRPGEELIVDYGEDSTGMFMLRYGVVPKQLIRRANANEVYEVLMPQNLKPAPSDSLRLKAIAEIFGFSGFEDGAGCVLSQQDLFDAKGFLEPDNFRSFRQLCVLFIADAGEIQTFCECNGARFRFNPDLARLVETFTRIFDHNLALLKAYEGESPLRSIERKGLEAWREFLLNRYDPEGIFRS